MQVNFRASTKPASPDQAHSRIRRLHIFVDYLATKRLLAETLHVKDSDADLIAQTKDDCERWSVTLTRNGNATRSGWPMGWSPACAPNRWAKG